MYNEIKVFFHSLSDFIKIWYRSPISMRHLFNDNFCLTKTSSRNQPSITFRNEPRMVYKTQYKHDKHLGIYHECEDEIENPLRGSPFWHHETCPVTTNGDHEGQIFDSTPCTDPEGGGGEEGVRTPCKITKIYGNIAKLVRIF